MVLKIEPQTFKSSYIKLIALVWSVAYSLLVFLTPLTGFSFVAVAILTVVGVAYLITVIVYILVRNVRRDCKCLKVVWFVDIAYAIGGFVYYVGRHLPYLLTSLSCGHNNSCLLSLRVVQSILLGMSVVIHRFIPFFISKYYQSNLAKEHQTTEAKLQLVPQWILAAESLTLLVEFDALNTVITRAFVPTLVCTETSQVIGAWVLWGVFVLTYIFILYYTMNIQNYDKYFINCCCVTSYLVAILFVFVFGFHLLSSDFISIGCTGIEAGNQGWIFFVVLVIMRVLVMIVFITVIVLLLVYRCLSKTRQEKLLPRALYQHLHPESNGQNDLPLDSITSDSDKKDTV